VFNAFLDSEPMRDLTKCIIIIIIYLFTKHIHIDGRKQDSGTGQQDTHSTLTVGLHKACSYCECKII